MKSFNLKFSDVKNFLGRLAKNLGWVFFGFFLLLVLFEIFEINASLQIFLSLSQSQPAPISKEKGVRINFDNYDQVVKKIQQGSTFVPTDGITKNPFSISR